VKASHKRRRKRVCGKGEGGPTTATTKRRERENENRGGVRQGQPVRDCSNSLERRRKEGGEDTWKGKGEPTTRRKRRKGDEHLEGG